MAWTWITNLNYKGGHLSFGSYFGLGLLLRLFFGALGACVTPRAGERKPLRAACRGKKLVII